MAPRVEHDVPGVEVLTIELGESPTGSSSQPSEGVDHALCARVTERVRDYLGELHVDVSVPGRKDHFAEPTPFRTVVGREPASKSTGRWFEAN